MTSAVPEFSRLVDVSELPETGTTFDVSANDREREALAVRFGLGDLNMLSATLELHPSDGGMIRLAGRLRARLEQTCVVTLEPVQQTVEEQFTVLYARPPAADLPAVEVDVDALEDGPPEPILEDTVDLGEVVAEHLGLSIDPYPRAAGVSLASLKAAMDDPQPAQNRDDGPFAKLARLKRKD